jgi:hypothetical protein
VTAAVSKVFAATGTVFYPGFFTSSALLAATLTMLPMGAARGACNAAEQMLVPATGEAVGRAWDTTASAATAVGVMDAAAVNGQVRAFRETMKSRSLMVDILNSTGVLGAPLRRLAASFLPSADVLVDKIVLASARSTGGGGGGGGGSSDSAALIAAAANGVVHEHVAGVRTKATVAGLVALGLSLGVVVAIDQSAGRTAAAAQEAKDAAAAKIQKAKDAVAGAAGTVGEVSGDLRRRTVVRACVRACVRARACAWTSND